jgi:hypothetical protein
MLCMDRHARDADDAQWVDADIKEEVRSSSTVALSAKGQSHIMCMRISATATIYIR